MADNDRYRYRLPAALGGGEYEGIENGAYVLLDIPNVGTVPFDAAVVRKIVPDEPIDGSWVVIFNSEGYPNVWSRNDDPSMGSTEAARWWWHDRQEWVTWRDIYAMGTPRRLVYSGLLVNTGGVRGLCPTCEKMVPIRIDGRLSSHGGSRRSGCPGSNGKPAAGVQ